MLNIILKRNDKGYAFNYVLKSDSGNLVNLLGCSVRFKMTNNENVLIDSPATIENITQGIVSYTFTEQDTLFAGNFIGEFVVTNEETSLVYPRVDYINIIIQSNVDTSATNIILDAIAERQGEFTKKLDEILAKGIGSGSSGGLLYPTFEVNIETGMLEVSGSDGTNFEIDENGYLEVTI